MQTKARKSVRQLLGLVVLGVGIVSSSANAQEQKVWKHGIVAAKSDAGFVFMVTKGFAEKQGIKVEIVQFNGDALALKALIAGELDSYEGSPGAPLIANSRGGDIKLLGCQWPVLTYVIYSKPSLTGPADLKGKTIAISAPGSLPDLIVRTALDNNKLTANDVKFAIMGADADRFKALTAGVVDVAAASSGFVPAAEKAGLKILLEGHDVAPNYLRFCTYSTAAVLAKHKADAVKFMTAEMQAQQYALDHREETIALTREVTGAKADDPQPDYIYDEVKKFTAVDPTMPIPDEKIAWMRDLLVKTGNLTRPVDLKAFVDPSVREQALKNLK